MTTLPASFPRPRATVLRLVLAAVAVLMMAVTARAATGGGTLSDDPADRLSTIPHNAVIESALREGGADMIAVRHEGWDESLASWARIKLYEITGRRTIRGQDPVFTVLSMMYEREKWYSAKILPIEHPRIGQMLGVGGKWISPEEVTANEKIGELTRALQDARATRDEHSELVKRINAAHQARAIGLDRPGVFDSVTPMEMDAAEIEALATNDAAYEAAHERRKTLAKVVAEDKAFLAAGEKLFGRTMKALALADEFLVVPDPRSVDDAWLAAHKAGDILPSAIADDVGATGGMRVEQVATKPAAAAPRADLLTAAATLDAVLREAFTSADASPLRDSIAAFRETVQRSRSYPTEAYLLKKNFYVRHNPFVSATWIYGVALLLFGLFAFFEKPVWRIAATSVLGVGLLVHSYGLVLRLLLTGHMPVSNMYESIVFTTWTAMGLGLGFELFRRKGMVGLAAAAVGFLAMLGVGLMPLHETRIHPLRAVLNSYWLNIHVTAMLISYGAFMVAAFFGAGYLVKSLLGRDALFGREPLMSMDQMEEFAYRLVQVGWPILTVGIMLGAVWADTAWGRFWGWDPKETWAFITWIVYTIYLHSRMVMGWKGRISSIACVVGFVMVLITWLGVSYLPWFAGGLHTYAAAGG